MNYKHLSIEERSCIRKYYVEGLSYRKIAQLIGRSPSTVSREIRRNCTHMYDIPTYYPHTAQKKISASALILPSRDVLVAGCNRVHQREAQSHLVAGANCLHTVRPEDAELAHDIPLDIRKISRERKPESAAAQGKKPRCERNARQV